MWQRWNRCRFLTTGTGLSRSDRTGRSEICTHYLSVPIPSQDSEFGIVTFQLKFITHILWDDKSRQVNKIDRWWLVWNSYRYRTDLWCMTLLLISVLTVYWTVIIFIEILYSYEWNSSIHNIEWQKKMIHVL